ncbi:hypothetical protein [Azospirillum brasilense]|uniref:hypothetical protein n=1 Tax=Azospirillum brasilense TaxID=192 RepID=UPI0011788EF7|nr:hypothetical protein [Azospirillum brasilense]
MMLTPGASTARTTPLIRLLKRVPSACVKTIRETGQNRGGRYQDDPRRGHAADHALCGRQDFGSAGRPDAAQDLQPDGAAGCVLFCGTQVAVGGRTANEFSLKSRFAKSGQKNKPGEGTSSLEARFPDWEVPFRGFVS